MSAKISTEDLMKPRFRVAIKFPLSRHNVGDIIFGDGDWVSTHRSTVDILCSAYPDVYKPLSWWEERKIEDMPEYVKHKNGSIYKQKYMFEKEMYYNQDCAGHWIGWIEVDKYFSQYSPSTETEYLNQKT